MFRPPTLWQQYRRYVVGAVSLLGLQTLLIAGLLIQRRRRARAELALIQSQRRLHLIADSLPALIAHVDRDQRYQFLNRAFERWFGLDPSQSLGQTMREVLGEPLYRSVRPYVERALSSEEVSFSTQLLLQGGEPRRGRGDTETVHEVVWLLRSDAVLRKVAIELRLDPDLPEVSGDRIQLQQVVMNLLLNAFDAMGESTTENRNVMVETRHNDVEIHVAVRDWGEGIAPETLERLFEPFNTSKPNGLGMGLSISRSIVGLHGGGLWGENNSGTGAMFSFTLPVALVPALAGGELGLFLWWRSRS